MWGASTFAPYYIQWLSRLWNEHDTRLMYCNDRPYKHFQRGQCKWIIEFHCCHHCKVVEVSTAAISEEKLPLKQIDFVQHSMTWYTHTLHLEEDKYGTPDSNSALGTCHSLQAIDGWYKGYVCTNVSVFAFSKLYCHCRDMQSFIQSTVSRFLKKGWRLIQSWCTIGLYGEWELQDIDCICWRSGGNFDGKEDSKADAIDTAPVTITDFKLKFDLPRGSYTTMLMREMLLTMVIRS